MILKKYISLCLWDDNTIILSRINRIVSYDAKSQTFAKIYSFRINYRDIFAFLSPLLRRLFRVETRYAIKINPNVLLIVRNRKLYELNILTGQIDSELPLPRGSRPLNITKIKSLKGFEDGLYFGEYFSNPEKKAVKIYKYTSNQLIEVFKFDDGRINHIHNIVADNIRDCLWIMTGDEGDASSIYMARNNFRSIERVVCGNQIYRSCVAFPLEKGLLYATDSQYEKNSIRMLLLKNNVWESKEIYTINGPCIYGTEIGSRKYFSTSVEGVNSGNVISRYLSVKRGPGIHKNHSAIIRYSLEKGAEIIYQNEKDRFPFVLFQFGNISFPTGENKMEKLIFSNIALKEDDVSTIIFDLVD